MEAWKRKRIVPFHVLWGQKKIAIPFKIQSKLLVQVKLAGWSDAGAALLPEASKESVQICRSCEAPDLQSQKLVSDSQCSEESAYLRGVRAQLLEQKGRHHGLRAGLGAT